MCMLNRSELSPVPTVFAGKLSNFPEAVCMWKQPPPAQKMGQLVSHADNKNKAETLVICEVFSQGVVHESQRLKDCLGFVDPRSKFQTAANMLSEIFVLISFYGEGVEEHITTSKMTKQQSSLFRMDWIWTLTRADKQIKLQTAMQASQLAKLSEVGPAEVVEDCCQETTLADEHFQNRNRLEKLAEFCHVVGQDCLGLFIMFGVAGKFKDIRRVMPDSIAKEEQKCHLLGGNVLQQFVVSTHSFLPTKDMLENWLSAKNRLKEMSNVYINFV
ncbi:LOW QUALITY PROTEIN: rab15 effector protein [Alca torda]